MKYNRNIHHRRSIRLKGYDYSKAGMYFITICTKDRQCLFGEVVDGKMILNEAGKIADECWLAIPEHFPDAILHEHVVMPNHVHGIVELTHPNMIPNSESNDAGADGVGAVGVVGAENFLPLQPPSIPSPSIPSSSLPSPPLQLPPPPLPSPSLPPPSTQQSHHPNDNRENKNPSTHKRRHHQFQKMIRRSVGSIAKGFKIGVTKWFRNNTDIRNVWQRNYHEHIIRDENEYLRIANYIRHNPSNWKGDKFYS